MHIHVNLWICNFKPKERGVSNNKNTFSYQIQDLSLQAKRPIHFGCFW